MALELVDYESLFRKNTSLLDKPSKAQTVVVASDGSGDTDTFREALKMVENNGKIFIKEGTYQLDDGLEANYIIPSNCTIEGSGFGTILQCGWSGTAAGYWINMNNATNVVWRNMTLSFYCFDTCEAVIEVDSANRITFEHVRFHKPDNKLLYAYFWDPYGNGVTRFRMIDCCDTSSSVNAAEFVTGFSTLSYGELQGNYFLDCGLLMTAIGANLDHNIVRGNTCNRITFEAGCDKNVCIGNMTTNAVVDSGAGNQVGYNVVI